jgi:hypothetical protein
MLAVDLEREPGDPGQDERADEDKKDMHAPTTLPRLFGLDFLFHVTAPPSSSHPASLKQCSRGEIVPMTTRTGAKREH